MKRSASEIIRDLEMRIAKLEVGGFKEGDPVKCDVLGKQVEGTIKEDHRGKYVFVDFGGQTLAVPYADCELVNQATAPWNPHDMFKNMQKTFPRLPRSQAYSSNGGTSVVADYIEKYSADVYIVGPTFSVAKKIMKKIGKLSEQFGFEMVDYDTLVLNDGSGYNYKIKMHSVQWVGTTRNSVRLYN